MGIRYYGWAVSTEETARALVDPWPVIQEADRRYHSADWPDVDLDKSWCLLQGLLRPAWGAEPRPAYALVAGDVTYPDGWERGYEPHVGVLPREQVRLIAQDVGSLTPGDLRTFFAGLRYDDEERRRDELDYVTFHLEAAQNFTADVAARGYGIVYRIG